MAHTVLRTVMHSPAANWPAYAAGIVVAIVGGYFYWALILLGALIIVIVEIARRADTLTFYDDGVAHEYQLVSSRKSFLEYDDVQEFEMTQSLAERAMNLGTIRLQTAGEDSAEIVFTGIKNPKDVEQLVHDCLGSVNKTVQAKDVQGDLTAKPAAPAAQPGPASAPHDTATLVDSDPS
jgi:uncharacterized membrane protein YdbT with pleckstrin-like domain